MIYSVNIHNTMFLSVVEAFGMIPEESLDDDDPCVRFRIPGMVDYVLIAQALEPSLSVSFSTFTSFKSITGETFSCNSRDKYRDDFMEKENRKDLIRILMGVYEKFLHMRGVP